MRALHSVKHVTESVDSSFVRFCPVGYPLIGPGKAGDATVDLFFSGRPMAVDDLICPGPGVCPEDEGNREAPEQYGENKQYD